MRRCVVRRLLPLERVDFSGERLQLLAEQCVLVGRCDCCCC